MKGHQPDPRVYRKSRERVGAQCPTRLTSGRFRREYAVLVGRNRATPRYHLRDRIYPMPELNNISNASLAAFAEGKDSASGYADTRSRTHATGEVLLSRSGRISIVTLLPVQICRQALDQRKLPPVRSLLRSPWRHSSRDRSLDAGRSYLWTASDRPAERLYA